ncbi:pyridoxal-phosphate dependent enzyme [Natronorarus salvus]|uniref:pyridoxal-phosphate dependent enzyme n=1 Tax=Natronorarus salvus TaxID=3117733 RepID=UPI002F26BC2E
MSGRGVADLVCSVCSRTFPASPDEPWRCSCGGPLELAANDTVPGKPPRNPDRDAGLWTFSDLVSTPHRTTLGEGWTPLIEAPEWDCSFKLEYVFPTGSFKDRGAATTLSRAAALGVERVVEDSSGNAGAAIATYAARAGIDTAIYVPADVKESKLTAIERAGARAVRVEGSRADVTEACLEAVEGAEPRSAETRSGRSPRRESDAWYASHAWNPAFFDGTQTVAFEVCAQRDWEAPDAFVSPLGHGTLFLGAYRGFRALFEAGWIDRIPRLLGAQAAGYAPIAETLHGESEGRNEAADGIQIEAPVRRDQILAAIEGTGGDAIALSEEAVRTELDRLHRNGFYTEPTCAVAPAALSLYRERGVIEPDDDVVVALTGSGLKT